MSLHLSKCHLVGNHMSRLKFEYTHGVIFSYIASLAWVAQFHGIKQFHMFKYSLYGIYFKRCNIFMDRQTCDVTRVHVGVFFGQNCVLGKVACHIPLFHTGPESHALTNIWISG